MKTLFTNMAVAVGLLLMSIGNAGAGVTVEEKCEIEKAKANAKFYKCVIAAQVRGIKKGLSMSTVDSIIGVCQTVHGLKYTSSAARAVARGGECPSGPDASEVQQSLIDVVFPPAEEETEPVEENCIFRGTATGGVEEICE